VSDDPFAAFKRIFPVTPPTPEPEPKTDPMGTGRSSGGPWKHTFTPKFPEVEPDREVDPTNPVVLTCKLCKENVERSAEEAGNPWVHQDEAIITNMMRVGPLVFTHNHEVVLDVIDTTCT
jgi:hypothetical protein